MTASIPRVIGCNCVSFAASLSVALSPFPFASFFSRLAFFFCAFLLRCPVLRALSSGRVRALCARVAVSTHSDLEHATTAEQRMPSVRSDDYVCRFSPSPSFASSSPGSSTNNTESGADASSPSAPQLRAHNLIKSEVHRRGSRAVRRSKPCAESARGTEIKNNNYCSR